MNRPIPSSHFTAWLPRMLVSRSLCCLLFVSAARVMPPKSKSKLQLEEGLQAERAAKLNQKYGMGTFSAV